MLAVNKENSKPRLKNLDDLFNLNNGVNPLEAPVQTINDQAPHKRAVTIVVIDTLTPFKGHPFHLYEGERLDDMVSSIKANGVLVPIIVRRLGIKLEILAGHNRINAAKLAGLTEIPAIIFDNISDDDAMVYVVETNLIQRSFSEMKHSEKAAVIALHHSKMFSQGKRNDILNHIKMLANPHEHKENETRSQIANKAKTITKVGNQYGLSKDTVARYLRVHKLPYKIKAWLDDGTIALLTAVTISFLQDSEQELVIDCVENYKLAVDMKKADLLRQYSEKNKLNAVSVHKILSGEMKLKPNRTPTVKINKDLYARYFKGNQSAKEVQDIVEKALEKYFELKV